MNVNIQELKTQGYYFLSIHLCLKTDEKAIWEEFEFFSNP